MPKITLDAATAEALKSADPGTELVGPDGRAVGVFVPPDLLDLVRKVVADRRRMIDEATAAISIEELRAISANRIPEDCIPHDEVIRRLGLDS